MCSDIGIVSDGREAVVICIVCLVRGFKHDRHTTTGTWVLATSKLVTRLRLDAISMVSLVSVNALLSCSYKIAGGCNENTFPIGLVFRLLCPRLWAIMKIIGIVFRMHHPAIL